MNRFVSITKPLMWFTALLLAISAAGCGSGGGQDAILGAPVQPISVAPAGAIVPGAVCTVATGPTIPTVVVSDPTNGNQFATTSTSGVANSGKLITATFSIAMNPATINSTTFTLAPSGGAVITPASVTYNATTNVATLTTTSALLANTAYLAIITQGATSAAGTPISCSYAWNFKTAAVATTGVAPVNLGAAAPFGNLGGTAGTTNQGTLTVINGDIGTTATVTSAVTGFHDAFDIYTETGSNIGLVNGLIYTCTVSTTGPNSVTPNAANCLTATNALAAAQTAYTSLTPALLPGGTDPGAGQLGGLTLPPGIYQAAGGSFLITGSDLTLDGQGDANAVWVFQMASTLTVGAAGAPRTVHLINGAQAKNVFWQVGTSATINGAGGGTMVGTILASSAVSFSTVGNVALVTLDGRAVGLNASVTMTNTVINVPAP